MSSHSTAAADPENSLSSLLGMPRANCPLLAHKPLRISSTFPSSPSPFLKFISSPHTTNLALLRNPFQNPKGLHCEPITRRIFLQTGGTRLRNPSTAAQPPPELHPRADGFSTTSLLLHTGRWVCKARRRCTGGKIWASSCRPQNAPRGRGPDLSYPLHRRELRMRERLRSRGLKGFLHASSCPRGCLLSPDAPDEFSCRPARSLCCPTSRHPSSLPSCPAGTNVSMPGAATGATAAASPKVINPTRTLL